MKIYYDCLDTNKDENKCKDNQTAYVKACKEDKNTTVCQANMYV